MAVQTNMDQLVLATKANIRDYLKGDIDLTEYFKRRLQYDTDVAAKLIRSSNLDVPAMSPVSVADSDSAYSSSPPTPPLHYSQDPSYSTCVQDIGHEDTRRILDSVSPGPSHDQQDMNTSSTESHRALCDQEALLPDSPKRQTTKPFGQQRSRRWTGIKREAADIDEPDPTSPKKRRNRGPKPRILHDGKGPIQLWQLIVKLLVSAPASGPEAGLVEWTGEQYGFKILQPDKLAQLWGRLKKKPAMNYEKLARSLRYYYDKSMLKKVPGKENTYEFTWDISEMLGYDPVHGSPVSGPMHETPVPIQTCESPVPSPDHGSATSDTMNGLPAPTTMDIPCVSNPLDGLPVPLTFDTMPSSHPMNDFPVYNPMDGFSVPAQDVWFPDFDVVSHLSAFNRMIGGPVSCPVGGLPVSDLEPSLSLVPTPLDFAMFAESDQKRNFNEVL